MALLKKQYCKIIELIWHYDWIFRPVLFYTYCLTYFYSMLQAHFQNQSKHQVLVAVWLLYSFWLF